MKNYNQLGHYKTVLVDSNHDLQHLFVCKLCGSVVEDTKLHTQDHANIEYDREIIEMLRGMIE